MAQLNKQAALANLSRRSLWGSNPSSQSPRRKNLRSIVSSHTVNIRLWTRGPEDGFTIPSSLIWGRLCHSVGLSQPLGFLTWLCVSMPKIHIHTGLPYTSTQGLVYSLIRQSTFVISPPRWEVVSRHSSLTDPRYCLWRPQIACLSLCCVALLLSEGCTKGR